MKIIDKEPPDEEIYSAILDNACWAKIGIAGKNDTSVSIADQLNEVLYEHNRYRFKPCKKGRLHGAEELRKRLIGRELEDGTNKPAIYFFSNCKHAIRTIPTLSFDEHDPEKYDTKGEDHAADAIIYFCLDNPYKTEVPLPEPKSHKYERNEQTSEWAN